MDRGQRMNVRDEGAGCSATPSDLTCGQPSRRREEASGWTTARSEKDATALARVDVKETEMKWWVPGWSGTTVGRSVVAQPAKVWWPGASVGGVPSVESSTRTEPASEVTYRVGDGALTGVEMR
jgi:hypothetical protein